VLSCPERMNYIANSSSPSGLDSLLDATLQEIQRNFGVAQVKGIQRAFPLKRKSDGQILQILPHDMRICELETELWNQVLPINSRGRYYPVGNKILLNHEKWCRKTLIHESLHSVSIFSHPSNSAFFERTLGFAEGLTEFLTGLLLWRDHNNCYENWRSRRFRQICGFSYPRDIRILFAFCGCVNLQCLIDLYFGTQTNIFPNAWTDFNEAIRNTTGNNFKDVLEEGMRIGLIRAFEIECELQFKKKFRKLRRSIDYDILQGIAIDSS